MKIHKFLSVMFSRRSVWKILVLLLMAALWAGCMEEGDRRSAIISPTGTHEAPPKMVRKPITRTLIDGQLFAKCEDQGYDIGFEVTSSVAGTNDYFFYNKDGRFAYDIWQGNNDYLFSVTVSSAGPYLSWGGPNLHTASQVIPIGVAAVIVKGGPYAYIYEYTPDRRLGDAELIPPTNPDDEKVAISHFAFCLNLNLLIDKTVSGTINRMYDWRVVHGITNLINNDLELVGGEVFDMDYTATISWLVVDRLAAASGTVTVENPWPIDARVASVEDVIAGVGEMPLSCRLAGRAVLEAGSGPVTLKRGEGPLMCAFDEQFSPEAEGTLMTGELITNTARVTTTADSKIDGASISVTEENLDIEEYNKCVTVTDTLAGELFAAGELPDESSFGTATKTWSYQLEASECGETESTFDALSIATITACDGGTITEARSTVTVTVPACEADEQ